MDLSAGMLRSYSASVATAARMSEAISGLSPSRHNPACRYRSCGLRSLRPPQHEIAADDAKRDCRDRDCQGEEDGAERGEYLEIAFLGEIEQHDRDHPGLRDEHQKPRAGEALLQERRQHRAYGDEPPATEIADRFLHLRVDGAQGG